MKRASVGSIGKGVFVWAFLMALGVLAGCAKPVMVPEEDVLWYQRATGAYDTDTGKVFYGIGKAASLQNRTLQRVSADNQARLEMARLLERFSTVLARKASPAGVDTPDPSETLDPALKALVHKAMQQAIITDHWAEPVQGRMFALCRLELDDFRKALNNHRGLQADLRMTMLDNLEVVHAQLSNGLLNN